MHLFLILSCLVTCYGTPQDDDWIDPTDMLNYDAASGRMKHHKPHHTGKIALNEDSKEQSQGTCQSDHLDCKTDANNWKQIDSMEVSSEKEVNKMKDEGVCQEYKEDLDTLKKEIEECQKKVGIPQNTCNPVFRRFLYRIINEVQLLGLPDESQPEVRYDAELLLTNRMFAEFLRFLEDTNWNAGPLDEALSKTLVRLRQHNEEEWSWKFEDYLGIDPFSAFMISLSLLCLVMVVATELWTKVSWFTQIKRLLALCFLVSIVWNWLYLYREAFAERQAKITKLDDQSCGKKMTWSENLLDWWKSSSSFQNDPCEEYFKALMVNPILLVPPTKAFAITFTNFITEPLKHIGKGIGEFFNALLAEMPLFYQPIVLILIAALLLVFCYGFGTNVHHMNLLPRNRDRERLLPPNPQREGYDRFIEGGNDRFYNNPQPIQPQPIQPQLVDNNREVSNRGPGALSPVDCTDFSNSQPKFIESISASQQPQRKQVALEKGIDGKHISDESSGQLQKKDDSLDQRPLSQQPVKEPVKERPLESQDQWEESKKDNEPLDKISHIQQDVSGSHAEFKENRLPDEETLEKKFIESISAGQQPQRKQVALEKGINGQHISHESSGQLQKKDDSLDQRPLSQQPVKELVEARPLKTQDQWEESRKENEPLAKISNIQQDFSGSHAKFKENRLPDEETLENKSHSTGKVKEGKESTEEEKDQQPIKRDEPQDHVGSSHLSHLIVEDIYTDPGNEEEPECLSFVILEKERLQDEMSVNETIAT